jgi:hypothetical protein
MFANKKGNDMDDAKKGLDKADKTLNKGLTGALTRGFMGKDFVNKMNEGLDAGRSAIAGVEQSQWLAQAGMDATAEVLSIEDTGTLINLNPVVRMKLKVEPVYGLPAFETIGQTAVSKIAIPRVGDKIKIKYNPADPSQIVAV